MKLKLKSSIDIYKLNDNTYRILLINTRQNYEFSCSSEFESIIDLLDGTNTLYDIQKKLININHSEIKQLIEYLLNIGAIVYVEEDMKIVLDDNYINRYDRQINFFYEFFDTELKSIEAQKKLIEAKILIFGCGSIGGSIAVELAMAGVENFILFDNDIVEDSDISRHIYFNVNDIGYYKTNSLSKFLKSINKKINIKEITQNLLPTSKLDEIVSNVDFIINSADEPYIGLTTSKISPICFKYDKPHYITGGFEYHQASTGELIIPGITPCPYCYNDFFKKSLIYNKRFDNKSSNIKNVEYNYFGGLASISLFSSSIATLEIIKYITNIMDMKKSYKTRSEFYFSNFNLLNLKVDKNNNCELCGGYNGRI